jgi:hypothetical protein
LEKELNRKRENVTWEENREMDILSFLDIRLGVVVHF